MVREDIPSALSPVWCIHPNGPCRYFACHVDTMKDVGDIKSVLPCAVNVELPFRSMQWRCATTWQNEHQPTTTPCHDNMQCDLPFLPAVLVLLYCAVYSNNNTPCKVCCVAITTSSKPHHTTIWNHHFQGSQVVRTMIPS